VQEREGNALELIGTGKDFLERTQIKLYKFYKFYKTSISIIDQNGGRE
jgi:hypothetical protein